MKAREALQELADKVKAVILARLRGPIGYNAGAEKNTLIGSNLEKSIDLYVGGGEDEIVFKIADYFSYVFGIRHAGLTPRNQNVKRAIRDWVVNKHVKIGNMKQTQIIWYVLWKLKNVDTVARPVLGKDGVDYKNEKEAWQVITYLDDIVDAWMDDLYDTLINSI